MKLPIHIGTKWLLSIAIIITLIIAIPATVKITAKNKDLQFARIEKLYQAQNERLFIAYEKLAEKARYEIKQTFRIKKNRKGQIIYVPSSTIEIDKIIDSIDSTLIAKVEFQDITSTNKTFFQKLKFWED